MNDGAKELDTRVRRLERSNRRWRGLVAAGLALVGSGALQEPPAHTQVTGLELVDAGGRVRAALVLEEDGPGLHLFDESGVRRASVVHSNEETALFLRDAEGDTRVGAAHFAHGGSGYALHGPGGEGALVLYLKEQGTLTHYGPDGQVLARFPER